MLHRTARESKDTPPKLEIQYSPSCYRGLATVQPVCPRNSTIAAPAPPACCGEVQAPAGFAGHVSLVYPDFCERCATKMCIEMCSGQAITAGPSGVPVFGREKCVHCGACLWNCTAPLQDDPQRGNIAFRPGAGGLHSPEN